MRIQFLGTGGAFEPHKGNASAILELYDKKILIDCGFTTFTTLLEKDLINELDYILLTHLHGDHIGSFPTLLAYVEAICGKTLPIIYPTEKLKTDIHQFLTMTFEEHRAHYVPISEINGLNFIDTTDQHKAGMTSYGYYATEDGSLIYYSGDTSNVLQIVEFLKDRTETDIKAFVDIKNKENPVHIYYKDAMEQLTDYTVYGYHCAKETMPEDNTIPLVEDQPEFLI